MHRVVFYTWQSDLPNATNRSFIQTALEHAAEAITADGTVDIEPVIDRDTQGVAGSPDIARIIFQKLDAADVVVADVSIIGSARAGRPTPNPNVLVELGYALKALGDERLILVFNTAFGNIQDLPFDLRMRRVISYDMPESPSERTTERKSLEAKLNAAIRAALAVAKPRAKSPRLSDQAGQILVAVVESTHRLINLPTGIQAGTYQVATTNPRELARWRSGIRELENAGLLEATGPERQLFDVTDAGYQVAEALKLENQP